MSADAMMDDDNKQMSGEAYPFVEVKSMMTRSSYIARLRAIGLEVSAQIMKLSDEDNKNEYEAFCWAFRVSCPYFVANNFCFTGREPKRLQNIIKTVMFDWSRILVSKETFEEGRERYKMGEARTLLLSMADAIGLDILDFVDDMKAEAMKSANELVEKHPAFDTFTLLTPPDGGIDLVTAEAMLLEMNKEIEDASATINRLNTQRMNARFGQRNVAKLAEMRLFFNDEMMIAAAS